MGQEVLCRFFELNNNRNDLLDTTKFEDDNKNMYTRALRAFFVSSNTLDQPQNGQFYLFVRRSFIEKHLHFVNVFCV